MLIEFLTQCVTSSVRRHRLGRRSRESHLSQWRQRVTVLSFLNSVINVDVILTGIALARPLILFGIIKNAVKRSRSDCFGYCEQRKT